MNDKKWVWHRRLEHANWRLISKLSKLQLARGLPKIDYHSDALCGACQKGKIVKSSFKTKDILSTSRPLELLHIDLFGQLTLHPYMEVNMDFSLLMIKADGLRLNS